MSKVTPIGREELSSVFGISTFKARADRWSLQVFGDVKERGITYRYVQFKILLDEFLARNKIIKIQMKPDHNQAKELIYQIRVMQKRNPEKEHLIDGKRLDVIWRRTPKSVLPFRYSPSEILGQLVGCSNKCYEQNHMSTISAHSA